MKSTVILILFLLISFSLEAMFSDSLRLNSYLDSLYSAVPLESSTVKKELRGLLKVKKIYRSIFFRSKCYAILGECFLKSAKYDSAKVFLYEALDLRVLNNYMAHAGTTHESIAYLHLNFEENDIALEHLYESLRIKEEIGNPDYLKSLYNKLGTVHFYLGNLDSAHLYYRKALIIYEKSNDLLGMADSYTSIGDIFYYNNDTSLAIKSYRKSVDLYEEQHAIGKAAVPLYNLGGIYGYIGEIDSSFVYYKRAMKYAVEGDYFEYVDDIQLALAETYNEINQPDSAIAMFQNYIAYKESVFEKDKINAIYETETRYKTKLMEEIAASEKTKNEKLKAEQKNNRLTIYFLLGAIGLITIVGYFWRRNTKQRAKLISLEVDIKNQEIDNLLKEQEAKSYAALLEGQSAERERIAQDLHDRLGGTLSAVKVHFSLMDQKVDEIKSVNRKLFDKVNGMLSEAVQDVRRISHDLASGRLAKLGLRGALNDLAAVLNTAKKIEVDFTMDDGIQSMDQKMEQEIYAIFQELVSNSLKHARATHIEMQLNKQDDELNIVFEDNGVGFDFENKLGKGLGVSGLIARVNKMDGTANYDTVVGRGTIVIINIPI